MKGHRERLIEMGLVFPLSSEEEAKRNGMIQRMKESKWGPSGYPCFVVYRSDDPYRHVVLSGDKCCREAEMIADKLYSWEASKLCFKLGQKDPEQPRRHIKDTGYLSLYKCCFMNEWNNWVNTKAQTTLFDGEEA